MDCTPSDLTFNKELDTEYEVARHRRLLASISAVRNKMKHGIYPMEDVPCFCGATPDNDLEVYTQDRYGLPHRLVICQECALVRANPRLTAKSYASYYNDEYRDIHVVYTKRGTKGFASEEDHKTGVLVLQEDKGKLLVEFCYRELIEMPETVVDFGSHFGGMLAVLKEQGCKNIYGIEIDDYAREVANSMGIPTVATLDELIEKGVKADFLIMQDIIEHLNGFDVLQKVRQLMKPDALLYVWTPGLFSEGTASIQKSIIQLAHTYQFCSATLDYVMSHSGFEPIYYNEEILSLWKPSRAGNAVMPEKPKEWVEYQLDQMSEKKRRRSPPFRGTCKFSKRERYQNLEDNYKKHIPDLWALTDKYKGKVMIVSGGPSVDGQIETMQKMRAEGTPVISIARMYQWCRRHDLGPDFVVAMDSTQDQVKGFEEIDPKTLHLICSVIHPEVTDKLPKDRTYIWDNVDEPKIRKLRQEAGYTTASVIGAGGTVTVSCLSIAINLGFRELHMFGADCGFASKDQTHATGIAGESVESYFEEVFVDGKAYLTSPAMMMFVHNILDMVSAAHEQGVLESIKFHGESFVNVLWDGKFLTEEERTELTGLGKDDLVPSKVLAEVEHEEG